MNTQPCCRRRISGYRLIALLIALAMLSPVLVASAAADSPVPENQVPPELERTARRLAGDLEQQGYEVARGYFKLYTEDDCPYSYEVLHSCLGNNPAAPYVIPLVPAWPDEWVDSGTAGMLGPAAEGYNGSYRFDPREAIVIAAQLPPTARYLGLQTYLFSRPGEWDEDSSQYLFVRDHVPALLNTFFLKLPNNQERLQVWADLSDPINNVVIENSSSAVWDQVRYFVITPDQSMDAAVRQALAQLGIADNTIFTEQIPSKLGDTTLRIGLDEESDDFLTLLRYAMPDDGGDDGTPSHAWREDLPLVVMRIRDTRPPHGPQRYPWEAFVARSGATPPETALQPNLKMLAEAICSRWEQTQTCTTTPFLNMKSSGLNWTGPECVKVGMNCLAPAEDAAYFMSPKLPFPDDRVYAVIGALGTQTGNATYVGLGLNSSLTQLGFTNIEDDKLAHTANAYANVPNHDRFFLQYFARDCTGLNLEAPCYSIGDQLPRCYDPMDQTCAMLGLTMRNYLLPDSQRGPAPELTLAPLVIALQRPQVEGAIPPSITTPDTVESRIGTLEFTDGMPSQETLDKVYDHLDFTHAFEAYVNALQGVSMHALHQGFLDAGVKDNEVLIHSELVDAKSLFLTANADTVYAGGFLDLTQGPIVLEVPPKFLGAINDYWFHWVIDFGAPGPDRGLGGKYLILPPGYDGPLPEGGFFTARAETTGVMWFGRMFLENNRPEPAVDQIRKFLKIYPYEPGGVGTSFAAFLRGEAQLGSITPPPETVFHEGSGTVMNTIPPNDYSYYEMLDEVVQQEPVGSLDPELMGSIAAIGIVKGQPFEPDARMRGILTEAVAVGNATGRSLFMRPRDPSWYYYRGSAWMPLTLTVSGYDFETPPPVIEGPVEDGVRTPEGVQALPPTGYRVLDARTNFHYGVIMTSPAEAMLLSGIGSQYLMATVDANKEYFDGAKTYQLTLPEGIPAKNFWSLTLYDNQTRSMLDTPQRYPRAGSQSYPSPAAEPNADGSTTITFAPEQPAGVARGNWIQTIPDKGWFVLLRLYGPLEPFFDKSWQPSEIELVPDADSPQTETDPGMLAAFQEALNQDGWDVSPGNTAVLDLAGEWCNNNPDVEHAMYTNRAPYLRFMVPKSVQEPQAIDNFQLEPDEAIVLIGPTPPPVKYFGYHAFLWSKVHSDGTRQWLFATLGDTVNNATIRTSEPMPFNSPVVIIFTPDQGTDARVRAALQRAGYPEAAINTIIFPASMLNLGHGEAADELRIVLRIGMPEDPDAISSFMEYAPETIKVFRVTPGVPAQLNPFPAPSLRVRGTGQTEMDLMNKLDQLREGIVAANPGWQAVDIPSKPNWYEGYDYIQRGLNPWADSRDAFFLTAGYLPEFGSTDELTLADDEFLMVYGANHVATGKTTYMSVNVYASEEGKLSIGQVVHDSLSDTAAPYLPVGDAAADLMYAYKVALDCGSEPNCLSLAVDDCPRLTIGPDTVLGLIFRNYLEPATKVGPALTEMLYDRVIKFSPKSP